MHYDPWIMASFSPQSLVFFLLVVICCCWAASLNKRRNLLWCFLCEPTWCQMVSLWTLENWEYFKTSTKPSSLLCEQKGEELQVELWTREAAWGWGQSGLWWFYWGEFLAVQASSISDIVCRSVCWSEPTNNQILQSLQSLKSLQRQRFRFRLWAI